MTVYNAAISEYIRDLFAQEDEALRFIRQNTPERGLPDISITAEEGRFLSLLVHACQARIVLEIGTLGGYSGTWIARALPPGGKLITLEKSGLHAQVAEEHFQRAGVSDRVEIRVGDAHQLLSKLNPQAPFDMIFIDAEKPGYPEYYAWALDHVRRGGLITAHNALWGGAVIGEHSGEGINYVREFNLLVARDERVASTIYPAGDGTLVAVKL
jgi:caffeoyl-CoA O-methyltransferase